MCLFGHGVKATQLAIKGADKQDLVRRMIESLIVVNVMWMLDEASFPLAYEASVEVARQYSKHLKMESHLQWWQNSLD